MSMHKTFKAHQTQKFLELSMVGKQTTELNRQHVKRELDLYQNTRKAEWPRRS